MNVSKLQTLLLNTTRHFKCCPTLSAVVVKNQPVMSSESEKGYLPSHPCPVCCVANATSPAPSPPRKGGTHAVQVTPYKRSAAQFQACTKSKIGCNSNRACIEFVQSCYRVTIELPQSQSFFFNRQGIHVCSSSGEKNNRPLSHHTEKIVFLRALLRKESWPSG